MRLSTKEISIIKEQILNLRREAEIYLFGSRVYDEAKGGDIDILVICEPTLSLKELVQIKSTFYDHFGDQKLDIVCFVPKSEQAFKQLALLTAIVL